jgi:hypothetical protein
MVANIRAETAREEARKAAREADRAEAYARSVRMEGYGGPAQPSPTSGQCINGGDSWLEVECNRCKTRASLPLAPSAGRAIRRSGNWRPHQIQWIDGSRLSGYRQRGEGWLSGLPN